MLLNLIFSLYFFFKKTVRIMIFDPYLEHSAPIFKSLELLPIEEIFINRVAIVMFKIYCDMLPETMVKLCSKNKEYHAHDIRGCRDTTYDVTKKNVQGCQAGTRRFWPSILLFLICANKIASTKYRQVPRLSPKLIYYTYNSCLPSTLQNC